MTIQDQEVKNKNAYIHGPTVVKVQLCPNNFSMTGWVYVVSHEAYEVFGQKTQAGENVVLMLCAMFGRDSGFCSWLWVAELAALYLGNDGRNSWLSCLLSWDPLVVSVGASTGVGGINTPSSLRSPDEGRWRSSK
jgi:hypothetical protein